VLQAIVLGIVQGATEFAPISSSGHLIIVPWLFDWPILEDPALNKSFDVALHIGTLVGALSYFRRDVVRYTRAWVRSVGHRAIRGTDETLAWALVVGTIPGVVVGATFEGVIQEQLGQPWLIALMLAVFGVVLVAVDRACRHDRTVQDVRVRDGLIMGIAQAVALQPGVSRSGVTITAGRFLRLDRESAARFSFLLSLPIIFGAGVFKLKDLVGDGVPPGLGWPFFWGFVAAAVSGWAVIAWLLRYLRTKSFTAFLWYRLALAALIVGVILSGARPPGA
jgi:undecaprenyl-diphosphatase